MRPGRTSTALAGILVIFGMLLACGGPGAAAATSQTCELFRQMIEGIDTRSTREQQQLVDKMADAVQYTGNPELMRGVVDMGQGWLDSNPQQFAHGMRELSAECDIPYK